MHTHTATWTSNRFIYAGGHTHKMYGSTWQYHDLFFIQKGFQKIKYKLCQFRMQAECISKQQATWHHVLSTMQDEGQDTMLVSLIGLIHLLTSPRQTMGQLESWSYYT